jgi:ATP-dependent helicase/nuclease subunit A
MTRAIGRLVVCGFDGARARPEGCWYDLVVNALKDVAVREPAEDGDGEVWRYRKAAPIGSVAATPTPHTIMMPDWIERGATTEPPALVPLSPSSFHDEATMVRAPGVGAARRSALARGIHVHRLLQALPEIPSPQRGEAAQRYLAGAQDIAAAEHDEIIEQVQRLLDDPRFSELFGAGSRAEVPIAGRIALHGRTLAVVGQVDRLAVTETAVLIADYKTNRPAPERIEDVPPAYMRQLALYREVLAQLYPGKPVRAALVWTEVPDLMEVPAALMDRELTALSVLTIV